TLLDAVDALAEAGDAHDELVGRGLVHAALGVDPRHDADDVAARGDVHLVLRGLHQLAPVGAGDVDVVLVAAEPARLRDLEPGHVHRAVALLGGRDVHRAVRHHRTVQHREAVLAGLAVLEDLLLLVEVEARRSHERHVIDVVEGVEAELVRLVFA
ncbi:MAG: hypothetical protein ACK56I_26920, partial [bacterium]